MSKQKRKKYNREISTKAIYYRIKAIAEVVDEMAIEDLTE
jgi:hypothetical protein